MPEFSATLPAPPSQRPGSRLSTFPGRPTSDECHVSAVRRQIEALGGDVYLAEHEPQPGTSVAARVDCALRESDPVAFLIATNSIDSAYGHQEVRLAAAQGKPLVVLVDRRVDKTRLGLLREVECLEVDLADLAEAPAKVTQSPQPLIRDSWLPLRPSRPLLEPAKQSVLVQSMSSA